MTASDVPTTTGAPNNGFEGVRFLGYPVVRGPRALGPFAHRQARGAPPGPGHQLGADAGRQEDLDLPPPARGQVPRRHAARRRRGDLESRPVLQEKSPQFEAAGSGLMRARVPTMDSYRKVDDMTVAITTKAPASYFPYPGRLYPVHRAASFEKAGHDWGKVATLPAAGTGPFKIETVVSRTSVTLRPQRRLLGCRAQGAGVESAAAAHPGSQYAAGGAAAKSPYSC